MAESFQKQPGPDGPAQNAGVSPHTAPETTRAAVMAEALRIAGPPPTPQPRAILCPFCGSVTPGTDRCAACQGRFDPLSRQATQNHMGPWYIRDERSPYRPGCTYETVLRLVDSGQIGLDTVLRGPSTRQFWTLARHTPGVSHRLGVCHNCRTPVGKDAFQCPSCHAAFNIDRDRQHLGLGPSRPLPGQGTPEVLAMQAGPPGAGLGLRASDVGGTSGVSEITRDGPAGAGGNAEPTDPAEVMQHARARVARYREESRKDRQRGVIALVLASLVVGASLFYAGLVASRASTDAAGASDTAAAANRVKNDGSEG